MKLFLERKEKLVTCLPSNFKYICALIMCKNSFRLSNSSFTDETVCKMISAGNSAVEMIIEYFCNIFQAVPGPGKYDIKGIFEPEPPKVNTEGVEVEHPPFMSQAKVQLLILQYLFC